jgi:hypothetical protein
MLTVTVNRGHTFVSDIPLTTDDLNAAALPSVAIEGAVGAGDIDNGAVQLRHVVPGPYFYALASGLVNAYEVTLTPPVTALTAGLWFAFKAHLANTGPCTLAVSGLAPKAIVTPNGEALAGGEIVADQICWVQYDGISEFQLVSDRSLPQTLYADDIGAANAYIVVLPGVSVTSLAQLKGQEIIFKAKAANTAASTLKINGLGAVAITKQGATALSAGDIQTGALVSVAYDGTVFQITSFMAAPALPSVGAVGTQLYPQTITVDAQGRVTARGGGVYAGTGALPAKGSASTFTHALGRTPAFVRVVAVMGASTEGGYAAGDEFEITGIYGGPVPDEPLIFGVSTNATSITVSRINDSEYFTSKTGSQVTFNGALWTLKVYAW